MYLRTTRRKNKDGSTVTYYQLAQNYWDSEAGCAKARILYNFGRADELEAQALERLCASIARVTGQELVQTGSATPLQDVELGRARGAGTAHVALTLWDRLGIRKALHKALGSEAEAHERALFAMVLNRMVDPCSKLGLYDRWLETVWFPGCDALASLDRLYRAMDAFDKVAEQVEEEVFFTMANLLNLEVDVILYDTTTVSFHIDEEDDHRRFGHAKAGDHGPQIVVALAVTREGYPVRSWVFEGNTADVSTITAIRKDLRGWKLGRTLFVGDAGMGSDDNRSILAQGAGRYVLASRLDAKEISQEVLGRAGRYSEVAPNLHVKEVVVGDGVQQRRYVLCYNPEEEERQVQHRERVVQELAEKLASHESRSVKAKWAAVLRASGRYGRYLSVNKQGELFVDEAKIAAARRLDGKWVLITNDDTLSTAEVAKTYKGLLVIERCFRTLKTSRLRVKPVYHRKIERIRTHVKLCVLALLLERVAEEKTGRTGAQLVHALEGVQMIPVTTPEGSFYKRTALGPGVEEIFRALGMESPPLVAIP